jgi:hypothetical protein
MSTNPYTATKKGVSQMMKKVLQVPVIVGEGSEQFFIEKDICISPPSPPVYRVEGIEKWIEVTSSKVICGKVIFNALLWKNINYKTVEHVHDDTVNGPIYHSTVKIPFGGFVPITAYDCEKVEEGDLPELLESCIEGSREEWHDEDCIQGETVYNKLLEKTVVKLKFKVTRIQHVPVQCDL